MEEWFPVYEHTVDVEHGWPTEIDELAIVGEHGECHEISTSMLVEGYKILAINSVLRLKKGSNLAGDGHSSTIVQVSFEPFTILLTFLIIGYSLVFSRPILTFFFDGRWVFRSTWTSWRPHG